MAHTEASKLTEMQTITLELPDIIDPKEVKLMVYASLFGRGEISSGKAASLLGITRVEFLTSVGKYGISIFSDEEDDLERAMKMST